ncbi:MAG: BrnA antitoxin family protein [Rhodobacteraceae bacterium]|nr:BrnA antitoxin family protein [Paracoccaceae bacterium]
MDSDGRKAPEADDGDFDDEGIVIDDENPEWTEEDFARAKPIHEIPELADFAAFIRKGGRPLLPSEWKKRRVTIMLDPDVIAHFKAGGKGWQTRVNAALRKAAGL